MSKPLVDYPNAEELTENVRKDLVGTPIVVEAVIKGDALTTMQDEGGLFETWHVGREQMAIALSSWASRQKAPKLVYYWSAPPSEPKSEKRETAFDAILCDIYNPTTKEWLSPVVRMKVAAKLLVYTRAPLYYGLMPEYPYGFEQRIRSPLAHTPGNFSAFSKEFHVKASKTGKIYLWKKPETATFPSHVWTRTNGYEVTRYDCAEEIGKGFVHNIFHSALGETLRAKPELLDAEMHILLGPVRETADKMMLTPKGLAIVGQGLMDWAAKHTATYALTKDLRAFLDEELPKRKAKKGKELVPVQKNSVFEDAIKLAKKEENSNG